MIHDAAASGYQREARTYAKVRPSYPAELVNRFVGRYGRGVVVELGAGTGIFTRQLVGAGCTPIAVEPVAEMRAVFSSDLPMVDVREGAAEAIPVADSSADTIVAAQAFHWFNQSVALAEIRRVLRPGGRVVWMTSGQGHGAMPHEIAYAASKAALAGLTASVAHDLARVKRKTDQ